MFDINFLSSIKKIQFWFRDLIFTFIYTQSNARQLKSLFTIWMKSHGNIQICSCITANFHKLWDVLVKSSQQKTKIRQIMLQKLDQKCLNTRFKLFVFGRISHHVLLVSIHSRNPYITNSMINVFLIVANWTHFRKASLCTAISFASGF